MNLLVVNLDETATDEVSDWCVIFCYCYDLLESSWDDSFSLIALIASHHCMCFSTTSLSITKDCAIITFKNIINKREGALFINKCLGAIRFEDIVECETFWLSFFILFDEINGVVFGINFYDTYTTSILLFLIHWSTPDHDFDCFRHPSIQSYYREIKIMKILPEINI